MGIAILTVMVSDFLCMSEVVHMVHIQVCQMLCANTTGGAQTDIFVFGIKKRTLVLFRSIITR